MATMTAAASHSQNVSQSLGHSQNVSQGLGHSQSFSQSHSLGSSSRVSGHSVRYGAKYSRSGLGSVLGFTSGAAGASSSVGYGQAMGGSGLSRVLGGGAITGYRSGMGGGGLSLSGTVGLPGSLRGVGAGKALHVITSAFRSRVGQDINVGSYGVNYSFLPSTAGPSFGGPFGAGPFGPGYIDPASLPSPETVQHTRIREKQDMQILNNKFANLVDQVRTLEQHNAILKAQISMINNPSDTPDGPVNTAMVASTVTATYNTNIVHLRTTKTALQTEVDHLTNIIKDLTTKYEEQVEITRTLETEWNTHKDDIDTVYLTIVDLQTKVQGVDSQIDTFKQIYNARVREVQATITGGPTAAYSIRVDNTNQAIDLTTSLQEVKTHYEVLATKSREDAFAQVQPQIQQMAVTVQSGPQAIIQAKQQIHVYKLQIDSVHREIDRLHRKNTEVETQINETENIAKQQNDEWTYKINNLRLELETIMRQITQYSRDYQDLLSSKMALDIEIAAYKKLLDSEETRITGGGGITITTNTGTYPGGLASAPGAGVSYAMAPGGAGAGGSSGVGSYGFRSMGGGGAVGYGAGVGAVGYGGGSGFGGGMGMSMSRMSMGAAVGGGSYGSGFSAGVGLSSSRAGYSGSRKSYSSAMSSSN
uniref:thread biopolymer filament subunit alpha-like n=1 Tax=Myxine glutinosa TaxID=7769 RepID=UPI00358F57E6